MPLNVVMITIRQTVTQSLLLFFATATLEAFINELSYLASDSSYINIKQIADYKKKALEAEKSKTDIESKYILAISILTAQILDKGSSVHQDFKALIQLRNGIIHKKSVEEFDLLPDGSIKSRKPSKKADTIITDYPNYALTRLKGKKLLANQSSTSVDWLALINTKGVANWACKSAANMISFVSRNITDDRLKSTVSRDYFELAGSKSSAGRNS